ncbi:MAG: M50 family metallopeptidase [Chloroflexaceae bacterium]|jgi:hypothetical protein|nr:M50 family metallopeptidase [Chloroflexaceae bacterium]
MNETLQNLLGYSVQVLTTTLNQLLVLVLPGLGLAFVMHLIAGRVARLGMQAFGAGCYLRLFGWLGVLVHELGHAVFAILFAHRIERFESKLDHGQVITSYNPGNLYQNVGRFFVGIGPILFGTLVIYMAARLLLDPATLQALDAATRPAEGNGEFAMGSLLQAVAQGAFAFLGALFTPANWLDWRLYLFLYLAFAIGSTIELSTPDIQGAQAGFTTLLVCLLVWNFATLWTLNMNERIFVAATQFYIFYYGMMSVALMLNLVALVPLGLLAAVRR